MSRVQRGASSAAVLMVVAGLMSVIAIGFSIRTSELRFRDRTACRAAARWAAESALARGRARRTSRSGKLDGASYTLRVSRAPGGGIALVGVGECRTGTHVSRIEVEERLDERGRVVEHVERPAD